MTLVDFIAVAVTAYGALFVLLAVLAVRAAWTGRQSALDKRARKGEWTC